MRQIQTGMSKWELASTVRDSTLKRETVPFHLACHKLQVRVFQSLIAKSDLTSRTQKPRGRLQVPELKTCNLQLVTCNGRLCNVHNQITWPLHNSWPLRPS